ncbi:hypothetical protein pb186bvf_018072 [Paramecium bursaria]
MRCNLSTHSFRVITFGVLTSCLNLLLIVPQYLTQILIQLLMRKQKNLFIIIILGKFQLIPITLETLFIITYMRVGCMSITIDSSFVL